MRLFYFILSIVVIIGWLFPYLITGVVIYIMIVLWKIVKSALQKRTKKHQSNVVASRRILDEKATIFNPNNWKSISLREHYERNRLQERHLMSVSNTLTSKNAHLGHKIKMRILSFSINYWNRWKGIQSPDLYDYIANAAIERGTSAKRDFVKRECRLVEKIVEQLKSEVPIDEIVRIVIADTEETMTIGMETNPTSREIVTPPICGAERGSLQHIMDTSISKDHSLKDGYEVMTQFDHADTSGDRPSNINANSRLNDSIPQIINILMINAINKRTTHNENAQTSVSNHASNKLKSIHQIVCGLNASLSNILNGIMVNAIRREEMQIFERPPYWEHQYVFSVDVLQYADTQQKRFYYYFKFQFLKGHYIELLDNLNYAFVLMFDLANNFSKHKDYELLKQQLKTLADHYPKVGPYIKKTLTEAVIRNARIDAENLLRSYHKSCGQLCQWVTTDETIEVQGIRLTRGNFYVGECYQLPDSTIQDNVYDMTGESRAAYIYGPVLNPNLQLSQTGNFDKAFCSYYDMLPAMRYEYLKWLSGQEPVSEVPTDILLFYFYGCEIRMFIDPETKMSERWSILLSIIQLYESFDFASRENDEQILKDTLSDFIVSAIYQYFPAQFENNHIKNLLRGSRTFQGYYIVWNLSKNNEPTEANVFDIANYLYDIYQIVPYNYISIAQEYITATTSEVINSIKNITRKENKPISYYDIQSYFNCERVLYYKMDILQHSAWAIRDAIRDCYWNIRSLFRNYNLLKERCDGKETIAAIFLLPDKVKVSTIPKIQAIISRIENEMQSGMYLVKPIDWLLELWEYKRNNDKNIHLIYVDSIIRGLRRIGYDIIPDYQIDKKRLNFGDICVIYRNENHLQVASSTTFELSVLFINLAAQIVQADDVCDNDFAFIKQQLKTYNQTNGNYVHLLAFAWWRFLSKKRPIDQPSQNLIKKLKGEERTLIGNALIMLVCTNGEIHQKRIDNLQKVLSVLGLANDNIHSQINRMLTDSEVFAVVEKKADAVDFSIKEDSLSKQRSNVSNVVIDTEKVYELEQQTEAAHTLLSEIFVDEDVTKAQNNISDMTSKTLMSILKMLFTKEIWKREEVESICKKQGLMLGAILEQINDFAYEKVDDSIVEDDGINIYVTMDYKNVLI